MAGRLTADVSAPAPAQVWLQQLRDQGEWRVEYEVDEFCVELEQQDLRSN